MSKSNIAQQGPKPRFVVRDTKGRYVKLGGGSTTELSEANVVGWAKGSSWERYKDYSLIPVVIMLAEDAPPHLVYRPPEPQTEKLPESGKPSGAG